MSSEKEIVTLFVLRDEFNLICKAVDDAIGYMEDRCAADKYQELYSSYKQLWQKLTGVPYDEDAEEQPFLQGLNNGQY